MNFEVDNRIQANNFFLGDWPLSCVYLKNEAHFPWMILVPRQLNVQEIHELSVGNREQLMRELSALSMLIQDVFSPDKLNVGALGNIVPQLHLHVVARYKNDLLWPHGVWQPHVETLPYPDARLIELLPILKQKISLFT